MGRNTFTPPPEVLFTFDNEKELGMWHTFTDSAFGGKSKASLKLNKEEDKACAMFSGSYTVEHDGDDDELLRAGFCAANSKVLGYGQAENLEPYDRMVYEIKGDGHTYIANLRLEGFMGDGGDVWQAPMKTTPGEWQRIGIPFRSFVATKKGRLIAHHSPLARDKIISYGFAISAMDNDAPDADFRLQIREIRAERAEDARLM